MMMPIGGTDVWVMKLNPAGNLLWNQTFGGPGDDGATGLALDANGDVVLTGAFNGSIMVGANALSTLGQVGFLSRLAATDGTPSSAKAYGSGNTVLLKRMSASVDDKNGLVLAGSFDGTVDFGGGTLSSNETMGRSVRRPSWPSSARPGTTSGAGRSDRAASRCSLP
jgi:hypothetical protein